MYKHQCIAIASGKGGVGKSTLTLNICSALSATHNMLAIDCDLGLANLDILLGKTAEYTLQDILCDRIEPHQAYLPIKPYFTLLPSASGTLESIGMDIMAVNLLFSKLSTLFHTFDGTLLDLGASITPVTLAFIEHADHVIIVITPEPTSIVDSYALIKVLVTRKITLTMHVICSMVRDEEHAKTLFTTMKTHVEHAFNGIAHLNYLGYVPYSTDILYSIYNQDLVLHTAPESESAQCIQHISKRVLEDIFIG